MRDDEDDTGIENVKHPSRGQQYYEHKVEPMTMFDYDEGDEENEDFDEDQNLKENAQEGDFDNDEDSDEYNDEDDYDEDDEDNSDVNGYNDYAWMDAGDHGKHEFVNDDYHTLNDNYDDIDQDDFYDDETTDYPAYNSDELEENITHHGRSYSSSFKDHIFLACFSVVFALVLLVSRMIFYSKFRNNVQLVQFYNPAMMKSKHQIPEHEDRIVLSTGDAKEKEAFV